MITAPPLVDVSAGDPITSQAFNNIHTAIKTVYDHLNAQGGTVAVAVTAKPSGNRLRNAVVTFRPTGDPARPVRSGVFAGAGVNAFLVDDVAGGTYDLVVEADGFDIHTEAVTLADTSGALDLTVELSAVPTVALSAVPELFGLPLIQALSTVSGQGFVTSRVIDAHGVDIAPSAIPSDVASSPVLGQWPLGGTLVPPNTPVLIHVAAQAEFLKKVKVPDVRGMTIEDAKKLLEASGLTLGGAATLRSGPAVQ